VIHRKTTLREALDPGALPNRLPTDDSEAIEGDERASKNPTVAGLFT
jgi:hypothetical protein